MRIYIAGSGAMGCRFGYQLSKTDNEVILLDNWQDHIDAISQEGLQVSGDTTETVSLPIMKPTEATEHADLVVLFTKAMQLDAMLNDISQILSEDTKVLCLLNGLGHEEVIRKYVSEANILMGVTIWTAGLEGPGRVHLAGTGSVNLQALDAKNRDFALEVTDIFNEAGLNATYDEDVLPSTWRKACVNGTMNALCALLDGNIGEVFSSQYGLQVVDWVLHEFVEVAHAEGVEVDEEAVRNYIIETSHQVGHHYPSMHQDLIQNHRLTEIDYLNGAVAKKGERLGIPTPYCALITQLIHAREDVLKIER